MTKEEEINEVKNYFKIEMLNIISKVDESKNPSEIAHDLFWMVWCLFSENFGVDKAEEILHELISLYASTEREESND